MQFRQHFDTSSIPPRTGWFLPVFAASALIYGSSAYSDAASRATLTPSDIEAWQEQSFVGHTTYRAEQGGEGTALHATAAASASALCRSVQFNLDALPIAHWRWRLDRAPPRTDERHRIGDDQGLRVSFLYRGGTTPDSILAIQYVWSQNEPLGAAWANAFVHNAHEVAARSGPALPGAWEAEQRNLKADFQNAFGQAITRVDAVCIMTDGDQTGALVEGWYGDITLQAR